MKTQLFPRHALQIFFCFTLSLHWWYSIQHLVWIGQFLDSMKKNFLKILNNSQFAKFAKFRMKNHFFLDKHHQQLFGYTLSLHWWYSIPRLVWFGQLLDPMKKIFCKILKNSQFGKFAKFRMKNPFFLGKLNQYFLVYTVITLVILNTEFGLIWATHWPDEKQLFVKFSRVRNSRNSQSSVWNPVFPRRAIPTIFWLYTVSTLVILNTEFGLIWATPWLDGKQLFLKFSKIRNSRYSPNSVWKTIFS